MDDEWDAFQKSIKAETQAIAVLFGISDALHFCVVFGLQVSEALIEADDVVVQDDRQIVEWTEQRCC